jgi:hypothetical protein
MNILNKRITIKPSDIGEQVTLLVQGNAQYLHAGYEYDGPAGKTVNQFNRYISNVQANSSLSMARPENAKLLAEALAAEKDGNAELATDRFNAYLNAVQMSFSVIVDPNRATPRIFQSGDAVTAFIAEADVNVVTNGVTTTRKQLVLDNVRYKAPKHIVATKFDVADLLAAAGL